MAPFGNLYGMPEYGRSRVLLAVAKANHLELDMVETSPFTPAIKSPEFLKLNPLAKVPTFVGADGFVLTETIAIAVYLASQNEKTTLLGKSKQDYAEILKWGSLAFADFSSDLLKMHGPLIGWVPYIKTNFDRAKESVDTAFKMIEKHMLEHTFLVGERLTLADLFLAAAMTQSLSFYSDKKWRAEHPSTMRWFETVQNQPVWKEHLDVEFCAEAMVYKAPAKDASQGKAKADKKAAAAAATQPKKADKKKAVAEDDDDDDTPAPPKAAKHPLEELGRPTFVLDEWKRKYSNEDTRSVALPWFWENAKLDEYSLWRVDYKYSEELTQVFMSTNLIGGFFNRLEASRKYLFGALSVYGVTNDSVVRGAFLVRGQDPSAAFNVAPDWESYTFTKLDPAKDREFIADMWTWDKPVEVNGVSKPWADGKVFK